MSSFPADMSLSEPDGVTPMSSAWSLRRHRSNITQKYGFFPFLAGQKNAFLKRAKKKSITTLRFSRVNFNHCHPGDQTRNENTDMSANYQKKRKVSYPG